MFTSHFDALTVLFAQEYNNEKLIVKKPILGSDLKWDLVTFCQAYLCIFMSMVLTVKSLCLAGLGGCIIAYSTFAMADTATAEQQHITTKVRVFAGLVYPRLKTTLKENAIKVQSTVLIPVPNLKGRASTHVRKQVIVIDPGHGGYDPGAIGNKKVKEETVTLKAAQELRRQLLKTGRYKVVLTRNSDTYIAHEQRVRIARKAGADLFISLHADSLEKPNIRGASVYTLAKRAQARGQKLVQTQKQNWILDVDLAKHSDSVGSILVNLAQRTTLSRSSKFADILVPKLKKRTLLLANTHRQAGLYVLLAPDVPAVLLEMGFLSNSKDEALLNSAKHRKKLMKSVTEAINVYFSAQSTLQMGR